MRTPFGYHIIRVEEVDTTRQQIHARHILVRVAPQEADQKRAEALAKSVYDQAKKGADFGDLVRRYSEYKGPAGPGGNLGFLPLSAFPADFRQTLSTLPIGSVSAPLSGPQGYNIFKMLDRHPERPTPTTRSGQLPDRCARSSSSNTTRGWPGCAHAPRSNTSSGRVIRSPASQAVRIEGSARRCDLGGPRGRRSRGWARAVRQDDPSSSDHDGALPTEGVVEVGDFSSQRMSGGKRIRLRRSLGIVFEDLRLIPDRNVAENVALALQTRGEWDGKRVAEQVKEALGRMGVAEREHDPPAALSSGERQRVAVARALVARPAIVVADEPTRHLGAEPADLILEALRGAHAQGATVVLASTDEGVARAFGGKIVRLAGGRLEAMSQEAAS